MADVNLFDAINGGEDLEQFESGGGSQATTMKLKIELYQAQKGDDGSEFIQINMKATDGTYVNLRQYLNKRDNGSYKNHMYQGDLHEGGEILPSISWQLKELAKAYMGDKYEALKKKKGKGKLTRAVFENLELEMPVRKVTTSEGKVYYFAMTEQQKAKDAKSAAEYKQSQGGTDQIDQMVDEQSKHIEAGKDTQASLDDETLPF